MLRFFAKFQRSRNLVLLAFSILLLIGLIAFYIPNTQLDPTGRFSGSAAEGSDIVAEVGSKQITLREYRDMVLQTAASFGRGNSIPLPTLKAIGMDKQVLDQLISNRLLVDQAEKHNLQATDSEVSELLKSLFLDEKGNFIGAEEYQRRLKLQGKDIAEFENQRRDMLTEQKFRDFLTASESVSEKDVKEKFIDDNTKVDVVYATIDVDKIRQSYKPSEDDLKAFYESNKDQFKATEPTRKVDYIFISTDDVAKTIPVSEEDLRKEYENRKQFEFRQSVIKLNVITPEDESKVKAKIDELHRRVVGSKDVKPEDFATVARGNSQDASASKGGDIGWVKKDPNNTNDWKQRVHVNEIKVGDMDGPFRDNKSWYIVKVTDKREVPFSAMRETIKATLSNNLAYQKASQLADTAYEKATEFKDLRKAAEVIAKEIKVTPESLIKSTPYFKNGDPLPDLGKGSGRASNPAFEEAVSILKKGGISDKVSIPGGQAIPQLADIIENGQQLTYEQARNQVEDKLRRDKEPTLALAKAQEIVNQAKNADDFQKIAKAQGIETKTDINFDSFSFSGTGGGNMIAGNQARAALKAVKEGEVYKTPIKTGITYMIFAATKRTEADLSKLPTQRDSLRQTILRERQNIAYESYIKAIRKTYEQQGKIKVYQDRIDKVFAPVQQ